MVYLRFWPHVFFKAFESGPEYMSAAAVPFQVFPTTCHMMTLSFATAALIVTDGIPRKECFSRGFVQPGSTPSEAFRKCPVTFVFWSLAFCATVNGNGNALLSTYAWT